MSGWIAIMAALCVAAGCYQPSVEACRYTCNNQQCPSGLACNMQGLCAESMTATCDSLPVDAPVDAQETEVTVLVRSRISDPERDVRVVFADAAGTLVADRRTDFSGLAFADVGPGGSATVIRDVMVGNQLQPWASTYLDLPLGASIVSQQEPEVNIRPILIRWTPMQPPSASVSLHVSCLSQAQMFPGGATEVTVQVPTRCQLFDVVILALDPNNLATHSVSIAAPNSPSVTLPATWTPTRSINPQITKMPANTAAARASVSGRISATRVDTPILADSVLAMDGSVSPPWRVPADATLTSQLTFQQGTSFVAEQSYRERLPAGATSYAVDLDGLLLPWISSSTTDVGANTVSWSATAPQGTAVATPDLVLLTITHQDASMPANPPARWHIFGSGSRITAAGPSQSFRLPDVPGDHPFELAANRSVSAESAVVFDINAEAVEGVRRVVGAFGTDPFTAVPELRHVTVTSAQ